MKPMVIFRFLLSISCLWIIDLSCTTTPDENSELLNGLDSLAIPTDSSTFYFKIRPRWQDNMPDALDSFSNAWYSGMLFALKEPILKDYNGGIEFYRFTWLRSFNHPVVVRVVKNNNTIHLVAKVSDGAGGYEPGKIIFNKTRLLTQDQVDDINDRLTGARFWSLKTESDDGGADGAEWIIEVYKKNKYHMVTRWSPFKDTAFRKIGDYLLSISGISNETGPDDYY